jgi:hypothetical protein
MTVANSTSPALPGTASSEPLVQSSPSPSPSSSSASASAEAQQHGNSIWFSVPTFFTSVAELNVQASEGQQSLRIARTKLGAKFVPPPAVDLVGFKDGRPWFSAGEG